VTGADVSFDMIRVSMKRTVRQGQARRLVQADAGRLGFADDAFDCIVSVRFMGHIPEDARRKILQEFSRVAGTAIIEYSLHSASARLVRWLRRGKLGSGLPRRWAWHVFRREQLGEELAQAGLQIVEMWPKLRHLSDSWYVLVARTV
jgi:hypothetical protein